MERLRHEEESRRRAEELEKRQQMRELERERRKLVSNIFTLHLTVHALPQQRCSPRFILSFGMFNDFYFILLLVDGSISIRRFGCHRCRYRFP